LLSNAVPPPQYPSEAAAVRPTGAFFDAHNEDKLFDCQRTSEQQSAEKLTSHIYFCVYTQHVRELAFYRRSGEEAQPRGGFARRDSMAALVLYGVFRG
jgi:hypothetical protein